MLTTNGLDPLGESQAFEVRAMPEGAVPSGDPAELSAFQLRTAELLRTARGAARELGRAGDRIRHLRRALLDTPGIEPRLFTRLAELEAELAALRLRL